jgi:hypothetical protein
MYYFVNKKENATMNYDDKAQSSPEDNADELREPMAAYAVRGRARRATGGGRPYDDARNCVGATAPVARIAAEEDWENLERGIDDDVWEAFKAYEKTHIQTEEEKRINRLFQNDPKFREHCYRVLEDAIAEISAENRDSTMEEVEERWDKTERKIRQYYGL